MLRPLVNQPDIILFMATFGLTYFLIGFGELMFGGDPKVMITDQLLLPSGAYTSRCSAASCSCRRSISPPQSSPRSWWRSLAVFFQKTRIGRALRAVADSHQAALSVGISLE